MTAAAGSDERGIRASRRMVARIRAAPAPRPVLPLVTPIKVERMQRRTIDAHRLPDGHRAFEEWTILVPAWRIAWTELPPSQNEIMRRYRDKRRYQELVKGWEQIFWAAMRPGGVPRAHGRRRLDITRYVRSERYRLDRGNLVGGCKPVLDAAVHAGLLIDDREEHLDDHYFQALDAHERVEIVVQDG